jgi:hypothetical protein
MQKEIGWRTSVILSTLAVAVLWAIFVAPREINLPLSDQWQLSMPLAVSVKDGTFQPFDVIALYRGSQRNLFANSISALVASTSSWDIRLENRFTLLFGLAGALLAAALIGVRRHGLLALFGAALMLSLRFDEIWRIGLYAAWLHGAVLSLATLLLASQPGRWRFIGALVCAVLATFSMAGGMSIWPGLAILLVMQKHANWKAHLALAVLVGTVAVGMYMNGVVANAESLGANFFAHLDFTLIVLGAPLSNTLWLARLVGLAMLGIVGLYALRAAPEKSAMPLALTASAVVCAVLISLGRLERGDIAALRGWYSPYITLLPLAVLHLLTAWSPSGLLRHTRWIGLALMALMFAWVNLGVLRSGNPTDAWVVCARAYPESGVIPCANQLFWGPRRIPGLMDVLVENRLALFAED